MQNKSFPGWPLAALLVLVSCSFSFSQEQEAAEKKKPMLNISYFSVNNDSFYVKLSAMYKNEKKTLTPMEDQVISVYFSEADPGNLLGKVTSSPIGDATLTFPAKFKGMIDTLSSFDLVAETEATDVFKAGSGSVTIENVFIDVETREADSVRTMQAFVYKKSGGKKTPLPEAEMNFFIKRSFGLLPLAEANLVSDSTGMIEMEYTDSLPGDTSGILFIAAKLSDADTYGTVVTTKETKWGKKLVIDYTDVDALWASRSHVPIWLLFVSNGIIIGVWFTILFIVFSIYKIYKLGKKQS